MSNQYSKCDKEKIICQLVKVQAQITISPVVKHGIPKVYCINSNIKPNYDCCHHECCDYDCCHHECCDYDCGNHECCDYDCGNHECCDYDCGNHECCDCYGWDSGCYTPYESERSKHKCNFILTQVICVEIPVSIDADVDIGKGIVCCGKPDFKSVDNKSKNKEFCMQIL